MLHYGITNHIHIIRFISHQKINRAENAVAYVIHNIPAQGINLCKAFCHNLAKIIKSAKISYRKPDSILVGFRKSKLSDAFLHHGFQSGQMVLIYSTRSSGF